VQLSVPKENGSKGERLQEVKEREGRSKEEQAFREYAIVKVADEMGKRRRGGRKRAWRNGDQIGEKDFKYGLFRQRKGHGTVIEEGERKEEWELTEILEGHVWNFSLNQGGLITIFRTCKSEVKMGRVTKKKEEEPLGRFG